MRADQAPGRAHRIQRLEDPATLVDAMAQAVLAVDGVAGLHRGAFGEVATYLPGRRVYGIRLRDDGSAEVNVVVHWGASALATSYAVRRAASAVSGGRVDVTVADVVAPGERVRDSIEETTL